MWLLIAVTAVGEELLWPLDLDHILTSNFGEYRTGHPHAGIDLGTLRKNGVPVIAVDDGYISRLRTSPNGYGKAIYLTIHDGRTAVYAHLDEFSDRILSVVKQKQQEASRYSINAFLDPSVLKIKRGEVLGLSGDTGTDVSHLHFEIRGTDNCPLNPLSNGFPVEDNVAPVLKRIRIVPLEAGSLVSGWHRPRLLDLQPKPGNIYKAGETVSVWGPVGVELEVFDKSSTSQRRIAPYRLELRSDHKPVFLIQHDRYCYENRSIIDHQFDFEMKLRKVGKFFRLFDGFGHKIAFTPTSQSGKILFQDNKNHSIEVHVTDASGNLSVARLNVSANRPPKVNTVNYQNLGGVPLLRVQAEDPDGETPKVYAILLDANGAQLGKANLEMGLDGLFEARLNGPDNRIRQIKVTAKDKNGLSRSVLRWVGNGNPKPVDFRWKLKEAHGMLEVELSPRRAFKGIPVVEAYDERGTKIQSDLQTFGSNSYRAYLPLHPTKDHDWLLRLVEIRPWEDRRALVSQESVSLKLVDSGRTISSEDSNATSEFPSGSTYYPFHLQILREDSRSFTGLEPAGPAYRFTGDAMPFRKNPVVRLVIPANNDPARLGVYMLEGDRAWYMGNSRSASGASLQIKPAHLGTFAILRDYSQPKIWGVRPANGSMINTDQPKLSFHCSDTGSGLFEDGIALYLDGKKRIAEWHAVKGTVHWKPDESIGPGEHEIEISLTDKAGNSTWYTSRFTVQ